MNVPRRYRRLWRKPWARRAPLMLGFRRWLGRQGLLTPHFSLEEARCKDGTHVPKSMRPRARGHAFRLERLRHACGDRPLAITSWFRTRSHNDAVGGASQSKHIEAIATDHPVQFVQAVGTARFDAAADRIFANGGFGQYPGGARHVDSRGWRARWTSF